MICSIGTLLLYCAYGLHTLVMDLETGKVDKAMTPGVVLCSTPRGAEAYFSKTSSKPKCPKDTIAEICRCEPYGTIDLLEE